MRFYEGVQRDPRLPTEAVLRTVNEGAWKQ